MNRAFLWSLMFLFCLSSCQENSKSPQQSTNPPPPPPPPKTAEAGLPPELSAQQYPSVPIDLLKEVWSTCDFVDYTFYNLPISMSFDNQASIQKVLQHLTVNPPQIKKACKATGRAFFQKQGEDLAIAEFYLHKDCNFFVFLVDGKPTYANQLSPDGQQFYQNSIQQAMAQFKQQSGQ